MVKGSMTTTGYCPAQQTSGTDSSSFLFSKLGLDVFTGHFQLTVELKCWFQPGLVSYFSRIRLQPLLSCEAEDRDLWFVPIKQLPSLLP